MKLVLICVMMHISQRSIKNSEKNEPLEDDRESKSIESEFDNIFQIYLKMILDKSLNQLIRM